MRAPINLKCIYCGTSYKFKGNKDPKNAVCPNCKELYQKVVAFEKRAKSPCNFFRIKELLEGNECTYCHMQLDFLAKHIDHIIPVAKGGTNADDNLCLACDSCNEQKNDMTGEEYFKFLDTHPEEYFKRNRKAALNYIRYHTKQPDYVPISIDEPYTYKRRLSMNELIDNGTMYKKDGKWVLKDNPVFEVEETGYETKHFYLLNEESKEIYKFHKLLGINKYPEEQIITTEDR